MESDTPHALHNAISQEDLAEGKRLVCAYRANRKRALEAALKAGKLFIGLKDRIGHGNLLPYFEEVDIAPRTAQRWMKLSDSGLEFETVEALGGRARRSPGWRRATTPRL